MPEIVRDILRYVRDTLEHDPNTMFQLRLDEVRVFDRSVAMASIIFQPHRTLYVVTTKKAEEH